MQLGAFPVSLAVEDIEASRDFYAKLRFEEFGGDISENWLIMKNGDHTIGLFKGMFEKNMLTFNPGWDSNAGELDSFTDVRDLQRRLKEQDVELVSEVDESTTGPASFIALDPDEIQFSSINTFNRRSAPPNHWPPCPQARGPGRAAAFSSGSTRSGNGGH